MFLETFLTVAIIMIYAVIGFCIIKFKLIKKESIPDFAKFLMYVCQPILIIYSFNKADYSSDLLKTLLIAFGLICLIFALFLTFFILLFRKKYKEKIAFRIYTIASCFGNVGFLGVPILEAVLPGNSVALAISSVFLVVMNEIGWTVGSLIISLDKKYVRLKMIFLNPSIIAIYVALPLFFFQIKVPDRLDVVVTILAKMTTPLCMVILGMRLAVTNIKVVFCNYKTYIMIFVKQIIMPLVMLLFVFALPIDTAVKQALVILASAPIASVVLNFSEMVGEGQEDAASLVLCGTILCIITMPLITLLV
ncbi:MAG: AEC family transporter [Acholeplasmatales bacterium]|nr:AEC family transporter [Acholeplasmatales bacterium]